MAQTVGYLLDTNVLVALIRGNHLGKKSMRNTTCERNSIAA